MTQEFHGSLVALITPMRPDGRIDTGAYKRLLQYHLDQGTHGLVIGGTTGESPALKADELAGLVSLAVATAAGRVPVIAGSGSNDTAHTIELTRLACEAGADACLVVTPYYNKPKQDGLYRHYVAVADAADRPVILYNVPGRTGCDLLPETVCRLADHPRIVAIKEATADVSRAGAIIEGSGGSMTVLSGDDATALELMRAGAKGVISVTANVAPAPMAALCDAALAGDWDRAAALDARLAPLHRVLFIEPNPIPVKYAACHLGLAGPALRLPLTPLDREHEEAVASVMQQIGLERVTE